MSRKDGQSKNRLEKPDDCFLTLALAPPKTIGVTFAGLGAAHQGNSVVTVVFSGNLLDIKSYISHRNSLSKLLPQFSL